MASEKAQSIHRAYLNGCALVGVIVREDILRSTVDAELAEVREVLEGIRGFYGTADCWCDSEDDAPHFEHCQRARALYERLRIK